jgi:hypothetical protein
MNFITIFSLGFVARELLLPFGEIVLPYFSIMFLHSYGVIATSY